MKFHNIMIKWMYRWILNNFCTFGLSGCCGGSNGLMVWESDLLPWRLRVRVSGPAGIVGGGSECTALSPPSIPRLRWDPWARHRTPNCSPGAAALAAHCSGCVFTVCVCVFTSHCCVCALGWVKCRAQIPSMGCHTSFPFHFLLTWKTSNLLIYYKCLFFFFFYHFSKQNKF